MQDRLPLHPGRIQLTPVEGQANTYDLARKDEPIVEGSVYSKGNVLPDDVCDALGIDRVASEPKDALMALHAMAGESIVRDLNIMLNLSLGTSNIDAWADLLVNSDEMSALEHGSVSDGVLSRGDEKLTQSGASTSNYLKFGTTTTVKLGNRFTPSTAMNNVYKVTGYMRRSGSPTDSVIAKLYLSSDRNNPIATSTNTISSLTTSFGWYSFEFDDVNLLPSVEYLYTFERTGSLDDANYYYVSYSTAVGGSLLRSSYNGATWSDTNTGLPGEIYYRPPCVATWKSVTSTEALTNMAITSNQTVNSGAISWFLSDDNANWVEVTSLNSMQDVNFNQETIYLRCVLTLDATVSSVAWGGY